MGLLNFQIVPCGNPQIALAIQPGRRYNNSSDIPPMPDKLCFWCGKNKIVHPRRKYCSKECSESANLMLAPQTDSGRGYLLSRQDCKCNLCGISWEPWIKLIIQYLNEKKYKIEPWTIGSRCSCQKGQIYHTWRFDIRGDTLQSLGLPPMEIHHIVPVKAGGSCYGFDNLELLCDECHTKRGQQLKASTLLEIF